MVFANIFAFRLIFFINIKLNEKVTPYVRAFYTKHIAWLKLKRHRSKIVTTNEVISIG